MTETRIEIDEFAPAFASCPLPAEETEHACNMLMQLGAFADAIGDEANKEAAFCRDLVACFATTIHGLHLLVVADARNAPFFDSAAAYFQRCIAGNEAVKSPAARAFADRARWFFLAAASYVKLADPVPASVN